VYYFFSGYLYVELYKAYGYSLSYNCKSDTIVWNVMLDRKESTRE
jgi:hypothetical protein